MRISISFQHLFLGRKKSKNSLLLQIKCAALWWHEENWDGENAFWLFMRIECEEGSINELGDDNAVDTARFSIIYSLSNPSRWTISLKALLNFLHPNPPPSLLTFIYWASRRILCLSFMVLLQKILVMPTSSY